MSENQFLYAKVHFILVPPPPSFGQCSLTSFALATALLPTISLIAEVNLYSRNTLQL